MMRRPPFPFPTPAVRAALAALVVAVSACGDDDGPDDAAPSVAITDAWARTTPPGPTVGAIYFVAESTTDDALVSAAVDADVAGAVELHRMTASDPDDAGSDNAMMSMEEVDRLDLPAGDDIDVDEAGYHVMLVDLAGPLETGDTFDLTLGFERAADQTVTVEVREFAPGDD